MSTISTQASPFCGREDDLKHLQDVWHKVEQGEPQVVVLLAESGLGKTRLVQEFYNWLSVEKDGIGNDGYWPDVLTQKDKNLLVNPDVKACNDAIAMPYLWWAVRLNSVIGRNQNSTSAVNAYLEELTLHLENVSKSVRTYIETYGKTLKDSGKDILIDEIPGSTIFKLGFELVQNTRKLRADDRVSLEERQEQSKNDLTEQITNDLRKVMQQQKGMKSIPAVIVIDDAQFSAMLENNDLVPADKTLIDLADMLVSTALKEEWSVMFIFTHWEREWNEHVKSVQASIAKRVNVLCRDNLENWQPYQLTGIAGNTLLPLLESRLVGLSSNQKKRLLERAHGNPLFLEEIIRYCEENPKHFEKRSIENTLSEKGFEVIMELTDGDLYKLFQARFKSSPPELQKCLSLSSLQGMQLLPILCKYMVDELVKQELLEPQGETDKTFREAENPYAFLNFTDNDLAEFCQRVFYEVSEENIENFVDTTEAKEALKVALRKLSNDTEVTVEFSTIERNLFFELTAEYLEASDLESDRQKALQALIELIKNAYRSYEYQTAYTIAERVMAGCETEKWELNNLEFSDLWGLLEALQKMGDLDDAKIVAIEMEKQASQSPDSQRDLSVSYNKVADIQQAQGELDAALENYQKGLEIRETLAAQLGTPSSYKDLLISIERIGDIQVAKGDMASASKNYNERLKLAEQVLASLGTPDAHRDMVVSYFKLAPISKNGKDYLFKALDHAKDYQRMQPCPDSDNMVSTLEGIIADL